MPKVLIVDRIEYEQDTPSNQWTIVHNLNIVSPVVDVWIYDTGSTSGPLVNSDAHTVSFPDTNTVVITFIGETAPIGKALVT